MQSKQWITIIVAVIITAIVVGGGVYLWQKQKISLSAVNSNSIESMNLNSNVPSAPSIIEENQVTPEYVNQDLKFSLQIPDGYLISKTSENTFQIVSKPTAENETPLPEMNLSIKSNEEVENMEGWTKTASIVKEENIEINGVVGKKFVISDSITGGQCPIYRLGYQGKVYEFSLYECLESNIFEDVVESFRIISE